MIRSSYSQKTFFLCSLLYLIAGNSFFQSTVFLYFTELVAAIHSLMDIAFILGEHLVPWIIYIQFIWQMFLFKAYWMVPSLFQESTCSDLVFLRVLCFFQISTCNHPFNEWHFFYYKSVVTATYSFKTNVFFQNRRSCSKEIS